MFESNAFDAEYGVINNDGMLVPCVDLMGTDRRNVQVGTIPRETSTEVYPDGIMGEFNTQPAACHGYTTSRIYNARQDVNYVLGGYGMEAEFTSFIPTERLMKPKSEEAYVSGCNPRKNAFTGVTSALSLEYEEIVKTEGVFFGTHIHHDLDMPCDLKKLIKRFVKLSLIPVSLLVDTPEWWKRLSFTGIGNYRRKSYGVEWTDLGSCILQHPLPVLVMLSNNRLIMSALELIERTMNSNYYTVEQRELQPMAIEFVEQLDNSISDEDAFVLFRDQDKKGMREYWRSIKPTVEFFRGNKDRFRGLSGHTYPYTVGIHGNISKCMDDPTWKKFSLWDLKVDTSNDFFGIQTCSDMCKRMNKKNLSGVNTKYRFSQRDQIMKGLNEEQD